MTSGPPEVDDYQGAVRLAEEVCFRHARGEPPNLRTMHTTPYTLHPTPYTLQPAPDNLNTHTEPHPLTLNFKS